MAGPYRAAILTISDSVAAGTREDISGPAVQQLLESGGWSIQSAEVIPDDFSLIRERLTALVENAGTDLVITTGGTGVSPRDRTPEATTSVMERSLPGVAELMRLEGLKKTSLAALSRAVAGAAGKTVLVNLPGNPEGAAESLRVILEPLRHAVDVVRGELVHVEETPPLAPEEPEAATLADPNSEEES